MIVQLLKLEVAMEERAYCDCDVIHEEIVRAVKKKVPPMEEYVSMANLFKMFGDPSRMRLLHALSMHEMCVCDLAVLLGVTKSAVSHQLKSLRLSNLVKYRKEGRVAFYSLADDHVEAIIKIGFEHIRE